MKSRRAVSVLAGLALALAGSPAWAGWMKGETKHFVIHAESEAAIREYASMLEDFDSTLRLAHGRTLDEPPGRRLDVYIVRNDVEFGRVFPNAGPNVVGNYATSDEDIFAVAIKGAGKGWNDVDFGDDTVLHEYVHHFLMQYYANAYPAWLIEGYAEYYATADLDSRKVTVGGVNRGRVARLQNAAWLPIREVLSKRTAEFAGSPQVFSYYAEAWLLTHYLMSNNDRRRQLNAYLKAVAGGADTIGAWQSVFGETPEQLDANLKAYMRARIMGVSYPNTWGDPEVKITELSPGADAILLEALRAKLGRGLAEPDKLLQTLRSADAKYPGDDFVRLARARAEIHVGDRAQGESLLRGLIEKNPRNAEAQVLLAGSLMDAASGPPAAREGAYKEAGRLLAAALRVDPDNYQALARYAETRRVEPGYPTDNTYNAWLKAVSLAPQHDGLRLRAAEAAIMRRDTEMARNLLTPVANDPHSGGGAVRARRMLENLDRAGRRAAAP